jgi:CheY-like chemotaxis protein
MPVKDGRTATRELKSTPEYNRIPIVGFTAHVLGEDDKTTMKKEYGFDGFLNKPVSSIDLKRMLNKYI